MDRYGISHNNFRIDVIILHALVCVKEPSQLNSLSC